MKQHTIVTITGIVLLTLLFCIPVSQAQEKGHIIKIATLAPEGSSWLKTINTIITFTPSQHRRNRYAIIKMSMPKLRIR